ncbi:MAG TPA: SIR2 family protein [Tepidisphaeraceae bacterium]|jgi:hypothetical protein|nr:SIR2 family protein [Tepidisphaeraceae bacterium]
MKGDPRTVLFAGAGFTCCLTDGAAPLMPGFFKGLSKEHFPRLSSFLANAHGSIETANLQDVICSLEQLRDIPYRPTAAARFLGDIQANPLLEDITRFTIDRLSVLDWSDNNWVSHLLWNADQNWTVITTNYDTLAEQILSNIAGIKHCGLDATCFHCRMRNLLSTYRYCDLESRNRTPWRGSLLKLHGSIAWRQCASERCRLKDKRIITNSRCEMGDKIYCEHCCSPTIPVIFHPTPVKKYSTHPDIKAMWEAAGLALEEAEELIIFGFSFPQSDSVIRSLFRESLKTGTLKKIHIFDLDPPAIHAKIACLLPTGLNIKYHLWRTPRDFSVPTWWKPKIVTAEAR